MECAFTFNQKNVSSPFQTFWVCFLFFQRQSAKSRMKLNGFLVEKQRFQCLAVVFDSLFLSRKSHSWHYFVSSLEDRLDCNNVVGRSTQRRQLSCSYSSRGSTASLRCCTASWTWASAKQEQSKKTLKNADDPNEYSRTSSISTMGSIFSQFKSTIHIAYDFRNFAQKVRIDFLTIFEQQRPLCNGSSKTGLKATKTNFSDASRHDHPQRAVVATFYN